LLGLRARAGGAVRARHLALRSVTWWSRAARFPRCSYEPSGPRDDGALALELSPLEGDPRNSSTSSSSIEARSPSRKPIRTPSQSPAPERGMRTAALVEIQSRRVRGGPAERMHAAFVAGHAMRCAGSWTTPSGHYLDRIPGVTLRHGEPDVVVRTHRRWRGAVRGVTWPSRAHPSRHPEPGGEPAPERLLTCADHCSSMSHVVRRLGTRHDRGGLRPGRLRWSEDEPALAARRGLRGARLAGARGSVREHLLGCWNAERPHCFRGDRGATS